MRPTNFKERCENFERLVGKKWSDLRLGIPARPFAKAVPRLWDYQNPYTVISGIQKILKMAPT
jgi:hypothetical protein